MHLQHVSPQDFGRNGDSVAALQHNFLKAAVHSGAEGQKFNKRFTAGSWILDMSFPQSIPPTPSVDTVLTG